MCCFNFGRKVFSFALTFAIGLSIANVLQSDTLKEKGSVKKVVRLEQGNGIGSRIETGLTLPESPRPATSNLNILSKPRANYTDSARQNNTQGSVSLRVTFLADGQIGSVSTVNTLPDGLTEQAIAAARSIKFQPAQSNGKPISVTKIVQYNFTLY